MTCPTPRFVSPRHQRGIATILLVIFVGLALIVTVHGVFRAVRGAQEQTLAAHATTPAQATAWGGVEAVRRYLDVVDRRTVLAWAAANPTPTAPVALTLTGAGATNLTAQVTNVTKLVVPPDPTNPNNNKYTITARVVGQAGNGTVAAASPVEVVYDVDLMTGNPNPANEPPSVNFFRDLIISGDNRFTGAPNAQVNVLGNVTITATNLTGVEQVNATGDVSVDSAVKLKQVWSNGNVQLKQGSDSELVMARGTVLLSGGGEHGIVKSNGTVTFNSSEALKVETRGDLVVGEAGRSCQTPVQLNYDGTYIGEARVHGIVNWLSCGGGVKDLLGNSTLRYHGSDQIGRNRSATTRYQASQHLRTRSDQLIFSAEEIGKFTSLGNITYNSGANSPVLRYCAQGALTISQIHWGWEPAAPAPTDVKYGFYGTTYTVGDARNADNLQPVTAAPAGTCDFNIGTANVAEVPPYTRDRPVIDANVLKGQANIAFELNNGTVAGLPNNYPLLTVKALNKSPTEQVPDGVYTIGYKHPTDYSSDTPDWLCRTNKLVGGVNAATKQFECSEPIVKLCENDFMASCFNWDSAAVTNWTLGSWNAQTMVRGVMWFKGNLKLGPKGFVNTFIATGDIELLGNSTVYAPNYAGYNAVCQNADFNVGDSSTPNWVSSPDLAGVFPNNFCGAGTLISNKMGNAGLIAGSYTGTTFSGGNITTSGMNKVMGGVMAGNRVDANDHTTVGGNIIGAGQGGGTGPSGDLGNTFRLDFPSVPGYDGTALPCASKGCMSNQARVQWARYQ
jgi:hypothetical protein